MVKRSLLCFGIVLVCALAGSAAAEDGTIVFSKQPIAPAHPQNLTRSFRAGDHIYGLMMAQKTWREIYGESIMVGDFRARE